MLLLQSHIRLVDMLAIKWKEESIQAREQVHKISDRVHILDWQPYTA